MQTFAGNDLELGRIVNGKGSLFLSAAERAMHLYVCGATGTGKSKFLESLIRQDIRNWQKSRCGLILLDIHGSLYTDIMRWLAWMDFKRPVIPIDLRYDDWVIGYNVLRKRKETDPAVLVQQFVQAIAYVWGESGIGNTPLFARWASNILQTLYANGLSLVEAELLLNHVAKLPREALMQKLSGDTGAHRDWELANTLNAEKFEAQVGSTINRLRTFLETQVLRQMFGQTKVTLDLGRCLEEGSIVLVSLATKGGKVGREDARLFGTLLLSDLWAAAEERGKDDPVKPFYVYVDEFQECVTPTIGKNLDQARGFGLQLTLAQQYPNQLLHHGDSGKAVYDSVMVNARNKVVFSLSSTENLKPLAEDLFRSVMTPDKVKHELWSTKVMGYAVEYMSAYSRSSGFGHGDGSQAGEASGAGFGGTIGSGAESKSKSQFRSQSSGKNFSWSNMEQSSESTSPMLMPIMGKELSHVQFESLEEQLYRSMAALQDQEQRQCVVRTMTMKAPASIFTPFVKDMPGSKERSERFRLKVLESLYCALPQEKAKLEIAERKKSLNEQMLEQVFDEPTTAKRNIR